MTDRGDERTDPAAEAPGAPVDLVIEHPECVVHSGSRWAGYDYVAVTGGRVSAFGHGSPPPARERIDGRRTLVTPGFVNAHHHLFQNLGRAHGPGADLPLVPWLGVVHHLWPRVRPGDVATAAWVGFAELLLGGCTATVDHFSLPPTPGADQGHEVLAAARETGVRVVLARGFMDFRPGGSAGAPPVATAADYTRVVDELSTDVATDAGDGDLRATSLALGGATLSSSSPEALRVVADLAADRGLRRHVHLSESRAEVEDAHRRWGTSPVGRLRDTGWLGPDVWIAHGVWLDDADIALLADTGTGVSHCPSSNLVLASGVARVADLVGAGVPVGVGTDGSASSDAASMWLEARMALYLARRDGEAALGAAAAFDLATSGSAGLLGRPELGRLEVGSPADVVLWDLDRPEFSGAVTDPVAALLRTGPHRARDVLVGGRRVVRDGALVAPGLADRLAAHREAAARVQATTPVLGG